MRARGFYYYYYHDAYTFSEQKSSSKDLISKYLTLLFLTFTVNVRKFQRYQTGEKNPKT